MISLFKMFRSYINDPQKSTVKFHVKFRLRIYQILKVLKRLPNPLAGRLLVFAGGVSRAWKIKKDH